MNIELPILKCSRCGVKWTPRVPQPKKCPKCGSRFWEEIKRKKQ